MSIAAQLDRLYREIPGCRAVVLGDLQTMTVFRSVAKEDLCQEDHDRLLETAAFWMAHSAAEAACPPLQVTLQGKSATRVFVRLHPEASDVLCMVSTAKEPPPELYQSVQALVTTDG